VVALARDGQEAVEMAQQLQPDVAVMDINMPRMSGLAAIRNMQAASPGTVPMIISSEEQRDTLLEAMALGVRDYLLKPFTADALTAAIRKAAAQGTHAKTQAEAAKAARHERDKLLLQLVLEYFKAGRTDNDALKIYAQYVAHPLADPDLIARLAEVFVARRDWRTLRAICDRLLAASTPQG
jgi:YesN/AraC family two-component response regulator